MLLKCIVMLVEDQAHRSKNNNVILHEQAKEEFSCNATSGVLVAPLQHGASYHVVLLATNGAGLSTRTVSRSFIVDLFSNIEVRRCLGAYLFTGTLAERTISYPLQVSSAHWLSASAVAEPTLQIGFTATQLNPWAEAESSFELFSPFMPPPPQPSPPPLAPDTPSFPPEQPPPSQPAPSHPPPLRPPPSYPPPPSPPLPSLPPDGPLTPPLPPPLRLSSSKAEAYPTQLGANSEHSPGEQVRLSVIHLKP